MKLVNISNHPSEKWSEQQKANWDEIIDIPFPQIPPEATLDKVINMARSMFDSIFNKIDNPRDYAFHVTGEFSFVFNFVSLLKEHNLRAVIACTQREVQEKTMEDGTTQKVSVFKFIQWRDMYRSADLDLENNPSPSL